MNLFHDYLSDHVVLSLIKVISGVPPAWFIPDNRKQNDKDT